jgi:phage baseplate assembly protein W
MDDVPHLALPLRIVGTGYVSVQQDTLDEVTTCVAAITLFPLGYRDDRPDFGVRALELTDRPLALDIEQAVEAFEPRASVRVAEQAYDRSDPLGAQVRVEVALMGQQEGVS